MSLLSLTCYPCKMLCASNFARHLLNFTALVFRRCRIHLVFDLNVLFLDNNPTFLVFCSLSITISQSSLEERKTAYGQFLNAHLKSFIFLLFNATLPTNRLHSLIQSCL